MLLVVLQPVNGRATLGHAGLDLTEGHGALSLDGDVVDIGQASGCGGGGEGAFGVMDTATVYLYAQKTHPIIY